MSLFFLTSDTIDILFFFIIIISARKNIKTPLTYINLYYTWDVSYIKIFYFIYLFFFLHKFDKTKHKISILSEGNKSRRISMKDIFFLAQPIHSIQ